MSMTNDRVEIQLNGAWTDITGDVYERDPISITRGRPDQGTKSDPGRCTLTLDNRAGTYSPRNPNSPYYGVLGRNTPLRVSVPAPTNYLALSGAETDFASTPDAASLDLTGDLDIRIDLETEWYADTSQALFGKWDEFDATNGTFMLWLNVGRIELNYVFSGGSELGQSQELPRGLPRRAVLRAWLKPDDGAGQRSVLFYWGTSIDGPWTPIGSLDVLTGSGTLNVGTAPLIVGPSSSTTTTTDPMRGRVYRAQLRNGLDGPAVADVDFSAQTDGTTSFTDTTGLPWTVAGTAAIRDHVDRFVGEVSTWPVRWDLSSADRWAPIEANGVLRRMGQGAQALDSALRRRIPTRGGNLLAYWPLEEGPNATRAYSPWPGVGPMKLNQVNWASDDSLPASNPLPVLASSGGVLPEMYGRVPAPTVPAGAWEVVWLFNLSSAPPTGPWTFMRVRTTGTVKDLLIQSDGTGSRILGLGEDSDGSPTTVISHTAIPTGSRIFGQWVGASFSMRQSGSSVIWRADWTDIDGDFVFATSSFTGSLGRVTRILSPEAGFSSNLDGMAIGHIGVFNASTTTAYVGAFEAYSGETALARLARLTSEEDLPLTATDSDLSVDSTAVGPQRPRPVLELLAECADADGGILLEDRDRLGLLYRDRTSLYNQAPILTLDYSAGEVWEPFEPVDDDTGLHNDVTVSRDGGSSARAIREDGPLSVDAIGSYSESATLNLATDDQAEPAAYWRMHLGTVDEARYPSVTVLLHAAPHLVPDVLNVREGDKIKLINLPKWVSADDVELLVSGYSETIRADQWEVTFTCAPASPWNVGVLEDPTYSRVDAANSSLYADATATATSLLVSSDIPWVDSTESPTDFPFDLNIGGEVMTATATAPAPIVDDFNRSVSGGWGTSSTGLEWHFSGPTSLEHSVSGGSGHIALFSSPTTTRTEHIDGPFTDVDLQVAITPSQLAVGAALTPGLLLRSDEGIYRCLLELDTGGAISLRLVNGSTQVGTSVSTGLVYSAGTKVWLHATLTGQQVRARAWLDGTAEPSTWAMDRAVTGTTSEFGDIGVTVAALTGNTNSSPSFAFDDFTINSPAPQAFTVTRSVNGIAKAQTAGTAVHLAVPTIVAL